MFALKVSWFGSTQFGAKIVAHVGQQCDAIRVSGAVYHVSGVLINTGKPIILAKGIRIDFQD